MLLLLMPLLSDTLRSYSWPAAQPRRAAVQLGSRDEALNLLLSDLTHAESRVSAAVGSLNLPRHRAWVDELQAASAAPSFWDDTAAAESTLKTLAAPVMSMSSNVMSDTVPPRPRRDLIWIGCGSAERIRRKVTLRTPPLVSLPIAIAAPRRRVMSSKSTFSVGLPYARP